MSLRLLAIAAAFVLAPTAYVADPIIIKYSNAEQNKWRKAMAPVWKQFEDEIGRDAIFAAFKANKR